jgi:hypothetical protein
MLSEETGVVHIYQPMSTISIHPSEVLCCLITFSLHGIYFVRQMPVSSLHQPGWPLHSAFREPYSTELSLHTEELAYGSHNGQGNCTGRNHRKLFSWTEVSLPTRFLELR